MQLLKFDNLQITFGLIREKSFSLFRTRSVILHISRIMQCPARIDHFVYRRLKQEFMIFDENRQKKLMKNKQKISNKHSVKYSKSHLPDFRPLFSFLPNWGFVFSTVISSSTIFCTHVIFVTPSFQQLQWLLTTIVPLAFRATSTRLLPTISILSSTKSVPRFVFLIIVYKSWQDA